MSWIFWTLIAMALTSTEQVVNRRILSKNAGHWEYLVGYNAGALIALILICVLFSPALGTIPSTAVPLLLLSGLLWFIGCYFSFKADQRVEVSATSLVGQVQLVLVFLGGIFLLGESVSFAKIAGSLCVVLGIAFLGESLRGICRTGLTYKVVAATAIAGALLVDKRLSGTVSPMVIPVFGYLIPTAIAIVARPGRLGATIRSSRELCFSNVGLGMVGALAYYSLLRAFAVQDVSTAFPVYQGYLLLTILAAHFFLSESGKLPIKLAAAVTVVLGAVCLSV